MKKFSNIIDKIPFLNNLTGKRNKAETNNVDIQYNKAMELVEHGVSFEAVASLEKVADIGYMDPVYKSYGCDALKMLGEIFENGKYGKVTVKADTKRALGYYERYLSLVDDGEICFKVGNILLEQQNFNKALSYLEKAAGAGVRSAFLTLGNIYEQGLNRVDAFGNKSEYLVQIDLEKAKSWYEKLANLGDDQAKASLERIEYLQTHGDSIQFEEKDKLYTQISEKRKARGIEPRFKIIEASKLQYQYTYVHDQVEGFIHKLPKDWVKSINVDTDEEYYAPSHTYKDFAIYINYQSIPRESERTLEMFMRYENDAFEDELNITDYITEYADGICATFYHKELEKGVVTFAFSQQNRWACLRFVCATMDIIEQYEEIIFEVANSFAFVNPTLASDKSANRKEQQYYNEAVYYYSMEEYEKAMENARKALNNGSMKASYLLIELYFDEDSPYRDINKAVNYAQELYNANYDSDLAFLIGNIFDQQMKDYAKALAWYKEADALGHKRVPFYLGRLYYYGVLKTKRDGKLALEYFKKALEHGIIEADAYIRDIEELGGADLQETITKWEQDIANGNADVALKVAIKKKDQVFYMANDWDIENAFEKARELGSVRAAYELGLLWREKEKKDGYSGDIRSIGYFEQAFDAGYEEFDREYLYEVVEHKAKQGLSSEEQQSLYLKVAAKGYAPAIEKLIQSIPQVNQEIEDLYKLLKEKAKKGDEASLIAMNKLEHAYVELILHPANSGQKIIENKFFRLAVPKECTAVINDEGGTLRFADSVVEFAVAEMPVNSEKEEDFLKVFNLIMTEYLPDESAEIIIGSSRMVGAAMTTSKAGNHNFNILLISSKNQYLFKLTSGDRRELQRFTNQVLEVANSLVETGEIYIATGERANRNIGLTLLLSSNENGMLSISKDE